MSGGPSLERWGTRLENEECSAPYGAWYIHSTVSRGLRRGLPTTTPLGLGGPAPPVALLMSSGTIRFGSPTAEAMGHPDMTIRVIAT